MPRVASWSLSMLGIVLVLHAKPVHACRCREPDPKTAYGNAFWLYKVACFRWYRERTSAASKSPCGDHAWKSDTTGDVTFTTGNDCRYEVEVGGQGVLFLAKTPTGQLTTGRCMGNVPLSGAKHVLAWLTKHGVMSRVLASPPEELAR